MKNIVFILVLIVFSTCILTGCEFNDVKLAKVTSIDNVVCVDNNANDCTAVVEFEETFGMSSAKIAIWSDTIELLNDSTEANFYVAIIGTDEFVEKVVLEKEGLETSIGSFVYR